MFTVGILPFRENSHGEPVIEPGTSCLLVRDSHGYYDYILYGIRRQVLQLILRTLVFKLLPCLTVQIAVFGMRS